MEYSQGMVLKSPHTEQGEEPITVTILLVIPNSDIETGSTKYLVKVHNPHYSRENPIKNTWYDVDTKEDLDKFLDVNC